MKTLLFLLVSLTCLNLCGQTVYWQSENAPAGSTILTVGFSGNYLYASNGSCGNSSSKLYRKGFSGTSWTEITQVKTGLPSGQIIQIWSILNGDLIAIVNDISFPARYKLYKSTYTGASWTMCDSLQLTGSSFDLCQTQDGTLFLYNTNANGKILKSVNGGNSWTIANNSNNNQLIISDSLTLYSITNSSAPFKSSNSALSFSAITTNGLPVGYSPTLIASYDQEDLYLSGPNETIYKLEEGSATWASYGRTGLLYCTPKNDLFNVPNNSNKIYRSNDNGATFRDVSNGLSLGSNRSIYRFFGIKNGYSYVVVKENSTYTLYKFGIYSNIGYQDLTTAGIQLGPVPAKNILNLIGTINGTKCYARITDLYGHILVTKELDPLANNQELDLTQLAKGTYLIYLLIDNQNFSQKLIIE